MPKYVQCSSTPNCTTLGLSFFPVKSMKNNIRITEIAEILYVLVFYTVCLQFTVWKNEKFTAEQCGNSQNFPPPFSLKFWNFSVKMKHNISYLVKRAKIAYETCNFRTFRVNLRESVLNKSCRGGFGLLETIETCGVFAGVGCFLYAWSLLFFNAIFSAFKVSNWKNYTLTK